MIRAQRPAVQSVLSESYRRMNVALGSALSETGCAADAPYQRWRDIEPPSAQPTFPAPQTATEEPASWLSSLEPADRPPPVHPMHVLAQSGELAATSAANALRGHLALLGRAYWPDLHDPGDPVIAHPAIYPPARALLEAVAEVCWVLEPDLTLPERAQRSAELLLWSQVARRQPERAWQDVARAAGFDVRSTRKRPEVYYVRVGDRSSALKLSHMVRTALGDEAAGLYDEWSGSAHPDPIKLADGSVTTVRDGGLGLTRYIREDMDVAVAANVASLVAAAIECQAEYWGRSAAAAEGVRALSAELAAWLPTVSELVRARNDSS